MNSRPKSGQNKNTFTLYTMQSKVTFFFSSRLLGVYVQLRPPTTTESLLGCLCVICTCATLPIPGDANIHWWGPKHTQPETQNRGPTTQTSCPRLWEHLEGRGPNEWLLEPRPKVGVGTQSYFLTICTVRAVCTVCTVCTACTACTLRYVQYGQYVQNVLYSMSSLWDLYNMHNMYNSYIFEQSVE